MALALGLALFGCCSEPSTPTALPPQRVVVIGVDGAEWSVIEELWSEGRLPHLRALVERGISSQLETAYTASPVIWTTIATGVRPKVHAITDFVVVGERGTVPVSSTVRRVPALWNMLSSVGRQVGVFGWWASWPAEEVRGAVVSDRLFDDVADRFSPWSLEQEVEDAIARQRKSPGRYRDLGRLGLQDRVMADLAVRFAAGAGGGTAFDLEVDRDLDPTHELDLDLLLLYLRSPDVMSHLYWKHRYPQGFSVTADEVAVFGDRIPLAYELVDEILGRMIRAAGPATTFVVVSDHGFQGAREEQVRVFLDLDTVFEHLGYLQRDGTGGVDIARSQAFTWGSREAAGLKEVRFSLAGRDQGGTVAPSARGAVRAELTQDLEGVRYASGQPVFRVRDAAPSHLARGADLAVRVLSERATEGLVVDGEPLSGAISQITRISGEHLGETAGVFIAAGPLIDARSDPRGIHIHDLAPTLLFALGLPVATDFPGRVWNELIVEPVRSRPVVEIDSWGRRKGEITESGVDEEILRQLESLGYLEGS